MEYVSTTSSVKLFVVTTDFRLQIFIYNCVFLKKEKKTHETFYILKKKIQFEKEPCFENESSFGNPYENENMFMEK